MWNMICLSWWGIWYTCNFRFSGIKGYFIDLLCLTNKEFVEVHVSTCRADEVTIATIVARMADRVHDSKVSLFLNRAIVSQNPLHCVIIHHNSITFHVENLVRLNRKFEISGANLLSDPPWGQACHISHVLCYYYIIMLF
jgi:predicted nuclease of predicted toxin-antitoxin system